MSEEKKDAFNILADMRRKKEASKGANKMATMFIAFCYLVGFIFLVYLQAYEILSYISIFVFLIFSLVFHDFQECKRDIQSIDELYLSYEYINNESKEKRT
jgi:Flp pilus assembly protein TadB